MKTMFYVSAVVCALVLLSRPSVRCQPIDGGAPNGGAPNGGVPNGGAPNGGAPNGGAPIGSAAGFPLHQAAANRDLNLVKQYIGLGVNAPGPNGYTPLQSAIDAFTDLSHSDDPNLKPVVEYLLEQGANPNIPFPAYAGITGYTVLHFMAYDGNMEIVPVLVEKGGADVNAVDQRGFTPIMSAARCDFRLSCDDCSAAGTWKAGALPTIQYLVEKGADPRARNNNGQTALEIVQQANCPLTQSYLLSQVVGRRR